FSECVSDLLSSFNNLRSTLASHLAVTDGALVGFRIRLRVDAILFIFGIGQFLPRKRNRMRVLREIGEGLGYRIVRYDHQKGISSSIARLGIACRSPGCGLWKLSTFASFRLK